MILVTGGTGLVGSHLLVNLIERGEKVRAIYRSQHRLEAVKDIFKLYVENPDSIYDQIEWVTADVNDLPSLEVAFKGISQVYHSAAYISFDPKHFYKLKKVNIKGTANMVNVSLAHGIDKFCFVSSIAALGETTDGSLINEEIFWDPEAENNVYAMSKYGAEMEVWRGTQEGLKAVIVNPAVIVGTGARGSGSGSFIRMASKGSKYYTPGGLAIVDVRDVVDAMIGLMQSDISNQQYILAGKNMLQREFFEKTAKRFGVAPPLKAISKSKVNIARVFDWLSSKLFGTRRRLFKAMVKSLFTINYYDGSKIERAINFKYRTLEETLDWAVNNFRK